MVEIEDNDRLAELCMLAYYERREFGECRMVYIREYDAQLLRRSGADIVDEGVQGATGEVHFTMFRYKGYVFYYLYSPCERVSDDPPAGRPC